MREGSYNVCMHILSKCIQKALHTNTFMHLPRRKYQDVSSCDIG